MNLMKMPNRNLSVIYSDQISNTKTIKNKYFFRTSEIWVHTEMLLEVKK